MGGVALVSDRLTHEGHTHRGPFAVIHHRAGRWWWVVYGPAIAGIGAVPWWVCARGDTEDWPQALAEAQQAVDVRRAEIARALVDYHGHSARARWWRGRR